MCVQGLRAEENWGAEFSHDHESESDSQEVRLLRVRHWVNPERSGSTPASAVIQPPASGEYLPASDEYLLTSASNIGWPSIVRVVF